MKINEIEELLNIPRANIRFYEKENLIQPKRKANGYRDYDEEDISRLKRIIVFRKLGISVGDIAKIFDGSLSLEEAVKNNLVQLNEQIEQLNGAVEICKMIELNHEQIETFNEDFYMDAIEKRENAGKKFLDEYKDYAQEAVLYAGQRLGVVSEEGKRLYSIKGTAVVIFAICLGRGLVEKFMLQGSFVYGFFYPLIIVGAVAVIVFVMNILANKAPKVASIVVSIYFVLIVLLFLGIILLIGYGIIQAIVG